MLPTNVFLRESVRVDFSPARVALTFSLWNIELPHELFAANPELSAFFRREIPLSGLTRQTSQIDSLLSLLLHQGCLIPGSPQPNYSLREVRHHYISFCNETCTRYFSHRLWAAMRSNEISLPILRQWMARTYFLSRFAGVTAAAASKNAPLPRVRSIFLKSAIEEYAHCDEYFAPSSLLFSAPLGYTCGVAPAPCYTAFDQQMLRIARHDWLAHLFVALFQDRTTQYRDTAATLYSRIEMQLGMPGLFDSWRTHISFGDEQAHEEYLNVLFDQERTISRASLQQSFDEAALAIDLLTDGLEHVYQSGEAQENPRAHAGSPELRPHHLAGIRCLCGIRAYRIKAHTLCDLAIELSRLAASTLDGEDTLRSGAPFWSTALERMLTDLALACLEHCQTREEIILLGNLLTAAQQSAPSRQRDAATHCSGYRILENHFRQLANHPASFAASLLLLVRLIRAGTALSGDLHAHPLIDAVAAILERDIDEVGRNADLIEHANHALCAISLFEYALQKHATRHRKDRFLLWHQAPVRNAPGDMHQAA